MSNRHLINQLPPEPSKADNVIGIAILSFGVALAVIVAIVISLFLHANDGTSTKKVMPSDASDEIREQPVSAEAVLASGEPSMAVHSGEILYGSKHSVKLYGADGRVIH